MLKGRSAPSAEDFSRPDQESQPDSDLPRHFLETPRPGAPASLGSSPTPRPFVRRVHSPTEGHALEILGHAIEYLADEYTVGIEYKGPLGSADPRVEAIQILKGLNRAVYYSGTEVQPASRGIRRWFLGTRKT
jgi:hypothetical protein